MNRILILKHQAIDFTLRFLRKIILPFPSNRILIVRLDAIGDYILFRNQLSSLKKSTKFKNYKITLLGNPAYRDIAETYDKTIFDEFLWLNPVHLKHNSFSKLKFVGKLIVRRFDIVIYPAHSRVSAIDEFISGIGGKIKIASAGDEINFKSKQEFEKCNLLYDELISIPNLSHFEFYRNRIFMENLTGEIDNNMELKFSSKKEKDNSAIKVVLFPGARHDYRRWSSVNFAYVVNVLEKTIRTPIIFIIGGSADDKLIAAEIEGELENQVKVLDYTGKTTLTQLINLIKNCDLLISNETSAVHMAAAVGTNTICVSNGNHFGRFNPYPESLAKNIFTFYPDNRFYNPLEFDKLVEECCIRSNYNINNIERNLVSKKSVEIISQIENLRRNNSIN